MYLPENVNHCIRVLEAAGFAAYAVGGCVRDDLLGIPPHDYDLCTDATPEQTARCFRDLPQISDGVQHGTVRVVIGGEIIEITTFRQEGAYLDNRHPEEVIFVKDIEKDLARRDFTVNAIAWSPTRGYADPFGGREDLEQHVLRTVGEPETRFREDALRILRGIRFAARFGLTPEPETEAALTSLAPLLDHLSRERVFEELCGFLVHAGQEDITRFAPVLAGAIPELAPMIGFDQHSPHHAYDLMTHTAHVLGAVPGELTLRWAALLHDVGKITTFTQEPSGRGHFYGHAEASAQLADGILRRLRAPTDLREETVWLIDRHMTRLAPDRKLLRRSLSRFGTEKVRMLMLLQEADMHSKGTCEHDGNDHFVRVRCLLEALNGEGEPLTLKTLAVKGGDLASLGFSGREMGECLNKLLALAIDETLPNEKDALLQAASAMRQC